MNTFIFISICLLLLLVISLLINNYYKDKNLELTPQEKLYASFSNIRSSVYSEILNTILSKTPIEFEKLVVLLLQKMRQPLMDIRVDIKAERRQNETPSIFEKIHLHFVLYGALDHEKAQKAIDMSIDKYCSVAKILEKTCTISWDFEILPA